MELPNGFAFSGVKGGIKSSGLPDIAAIVADRPCTAAGVYTQNLIRAACIDWNRQVTPTDSLAGIIVNSGNANACTGARGVADNVEMAVAFARAYTAKSGLTVAPNQVAVLSTGVIGHHLPIDRVTNTIPQAVSAAENSLAAFDAAANAILTTDRGSKTAFRSWPSSLGECRIAAMCKGAGMIGPNLATMLGFVVTDFPLNQGQADQALRAAVDNSFNRISVEGHTSTNDAVLLLSSGKEIVGPSDLDSFQVQLNSLCIELAKRIPTDGEGANHLIHILVTGAANDRDADSIARAIALSNLVKTAIAGGDPNWGRIVSAAGYAGPSFSVADISLCINDIEVFRSGQPNSFDAAAASRSIRSSHVTEIRLEVGQGPGKCEHWTSDLTADYVKLNAEYTT